MLICQGQSIYDSQSDFAESMKLVVKQKIESGMSEEEIYSFFSKYNMVSGYYTILSLILKILPFAASNSRVLVGGIIILSKFGVLKKRL